LRHSSTAMPRGRLTRRRCVCSRARCGRWRRSKCVVSGSESPGADFLNHTLGERPRGASALRGRSAFTRSWWRTSTTERGSWTAMPRKGPHPEPVVAAADGIGRRLTARKLTARRSTSQPLSARRSPPSKCRSLEASGRSLDPLRSLGICARDDAASSRQGVRHRRCLTPTGLTACGSTSAPRPAPPWSPCARPASSASSPTPPRP